MKGDPLSGLSDVWSLGCTVYYFCCDCGLDSRDKFNKLNKLTKSLIDGVSTEKLKNDGEMFKGINILAEDFILTCLKVDPKERYYPYVLLNHPFITNSKLDIENDKKQSKNLLPQKKSIKSEVVSKSISPIMTSSQSNVDTSKFNYKTQEMHHQSL